MPAVKQHNDEDKLNPANRMHNDDSHNPSLKQLQNEEQQAAYDDDFAALTGADHYAKNGQEPNAATQLNNHENEFGYPGNEAAPSPRGPRKQKFIGRARNLLKKKGPIAGLVGLLVAGGAAFSVFLVPGISIMHFKELLTDKVNDQIGAVNTKTPVLIANKLNNEKAAGICTTKVNIHCKFSTSSKKHIAKFEKAGFKIDTDDAFGGRKRITKITFPEIDGVRREVTDPGELIRLVRSDTKFASAVNRAYYPKAAALSSKFDKSVRGVFNKFGISKASTFKGVNRDDFNTQLREGTRGAQTRAELNAARTIPDDADDETRNNATNQATEGAAELETDKPLSIEEAKAKFNGGVGVLGAVQSTCGIYTLSNIVEGSAKTIRALQLVQFAQVLVLNPADQIKAGDASPELATYIGDKITQADMRKTIDNPENEDETIENPAYGQSAMDSPIFKTLAYDDAPVLPYRSAQFMVGGGLVGAFASVKDDIVNSMGGEDGVRSTCKIVNSPFGQAISIAGMFTGVGLIIGAVSFISGMAFEKLLMPLLLQQAANTLAGQVVDENTANVDIGDAVSSGTATMLGTVAQSRGMVPMDSAQFNNYLTYTAPATERMIAAETEAAKATPFDIKNQYSFLGMFSRSVAPSVITAKTSAIGAFQVLPSFLSSSLATITTSANAATGINPQRFERCDDSAYENIGMEADVACNPRYGLPADEIEMSTEVSTQYMIDNGQINEEDLSGEPIADSDYATWVKFCTDKRTQGWGVHMEEADYSDELNTGEACLIKGGAVATTGSIEDTVTLAQASGAERDKYSYYRSFHFANSLANGMELEEVVDEAQGGSTTGNLENSGNIRDDGWAWPGPAGTTACGFDCYGGHFGMDVNTPDKSDVYAARDGKVIHAGTDPYMTAALCPVGGLNGAQQTIVITHTINGQKVDTYYTHLTAGSFKVKVGDEVKAGDLIGISGNTGCSTGPHLHFGIYQGGWPTVSNAVDPTGILGRSG